MFLSKMKTKGHIFLSCIMHDKCENAVFVDYRMSQKVFHLGSKITVHPEARGVAERVEASFQLSQGTWFEPRLRASDETIEFFRFSYRVGETRA